MHLANQPRGATVKSPSTIQVETKRDIHGLDVWRILQCEILIRLFPSFPRLLQTPGVYVLLTCLFSTCTQKSLVLSICESVNRLYMSDLRFLRNCYQQRKSASSCIQNRRGSVSALIATAEEDPAAVGEESVPSEVGKAVAANVVASVNRLIYISFEKYK